jgi:hypothetical protein
MPSVHVECAVRVEVQPPGEDNPRHHVHCGAQEVCGKYVSNYVGKFVILGLLFILLAPRFGRRTVGTLGGSPWASLGLGIGLLICVPIAALLVFVVGLFVGG